VHLWRDSNGNAPVLPAGFADWTSWLTGHPFSMVNQNGTIRTYQFYLGNGPGTVASGLTTSPNGTTACPTSGTSSIFTTNATCFVNLNTTSATSTSPAAASTGNNNNAAGGPIGIALADIAQFRPNPNLEETSVIGSKGNAFYNGLILELRSRMHKLGYGFSSSFRVNYTLSKTMDDGLNNTSNAEINNDFSREWARTLQDRRHRIAFSGIFETPSLFGKLRFSPLVRWGSSAPFNLGNGAADRNLDDVSTDRPNFNGNISDIVWRSPNSPIPSSLISSFSLPPIGARSGNLPRNAGRGPDLFTFDMNLSRDWKVGEHFKLRPVIEFDNILNAAIFSYGAAFIDFGAGIQTSGSTAQQTFLIPTRTYRQREIRLGMRFDF